jgi:hypothetical protein
MKIKKTSNHQQPTSNIQWLVARGFIGCSMLAVGYSLFSKGFRA